MCYLSTINNFIILTWINTLFKFYDKLLKMDYTCYKPVSGRHGGTKFFCPSFSKHG